MRSQKGVHWQTVVDHVNSTWKAKKRVTYTYPFTGKDWVDLRHFIRFYEPWGMMALWDLYLEQADDWTMNHGLSIYNFTRQLPRLLDQSWKGSAATYQRRMLPPLRGEIVALPLFTGLAKQVKKTRRKR